MRLCALELIQFRNSVFGISAPFSAFNGIFGPNGRGKTNFIEAIYYLTHFKSWRTSHKRDLIEWGKNDASLIASFESGERRHHMKIKFSSVRREVWIDQKSLRSWDHYKIPFVAILFSPEDAYLWRESPERRRATLDRMLFHRDASYASLLNRYNQSLKQKNAQLKADVMDTSALLVWNEQLLEYGSQVVFKRLEILRESLLAFQQFYSQIVKNQGAREQIEVYSRIMGNTLNVKTPVSLDEIKCEFRNCLSSQIKTEQRVRSSLVGPHRDDWWLDLEGEPVVSTASQGEHRSLAVALKLAELRSLKDYFGEPPLFLVDDLTSELDPYRRRFLIESLVETGCQTFLSSTDKEPFIDLLPPEHRIFEV